MTSTRRGTIARRHTRAVILAALVMIGGSFAAGALITSTYTAAATMLVCVLAGLGFASRAGIIADRHSDGVRRAMLRHPSAR